MCGREKPHLQKKDDYSFEISENWKEFFLFNRGNCWTIETHESHRLLKNFKVVTNPAYRIVNVKNSSGSVISKTYLYIKKEEDSVQYKIFINQYYCKYTVNRRMSAPIRQGIIQFGKRICAANKFGL